MASTIHENQVISYSPETLNTFHVTSYEWIDNLYFMQDPSAFVADAEPYLQIAKAKFLEAGWDGDGAVGLIWIPPFMFKGVRTGEFTKGTIVWHVKQKEDGISWLLSPVKLPCESEIW